MQEDNAGVQSPQEYVIERWGNPDASRERSLYPHKTLLSKVGLLIHQVKLLRIDSKMVLEKKKMGSQNERNLSAALCYLDMAETALTQAEMYVGRMTPDKVNQNKEL